MSYHKLKVRPSIGLAAFTAFMLAVCGRAHAQDFTLSTFHTFDLYSDGAQPVAPLIQAADGNLYGTTVGESGESDAGFYQITIDGVLTDLYRFPENDYFGPAAALVQGTDGNFYGVSTYDGSMRFGSTFRFTPSGALTTLYNFNQVDGSYPQCALVQGRDGNFYGTASSGGGYKDGVVFRMTPAGAFTVLHRFDGTDGAAPAAGVIQATDGNFYGTTSAGGANGDGTIFQLTPAGGFTVIHSFDGTDGKAPVAALLQGTDGSFYGTTEEGGANGDGVVFQIRAAGAFAVVHDFDGQDAADVSSSLIQARDGNFYGTARGGGTYGYGSIFRMTAAGVVSVLHSFASNDPLGVEPASALLQVGDGSFYGTVPSGGEFFSGEIYHLTFAGVLQFNASGYDVDATAGKVTFGVTRTGGSTGAVTARYATADDTALAGRDYVAASGTLNWADGDTSTKSVTVTLLGPGVVYSDRGRDFTLNLSAPMGGPDIGALDLAYVAIIAHTNVPVITSPPMAYTNAGTPFSYQITALNGATAYGVSGLPGGLSVNAGTGLITGTFTNAQSYPMTLNAYNSIGKGSAKLTVRVQPAGSPLVSCPATLHCEVGMPFTYQIVASGSPTLFGVYGLPGWLSVDPGTGLLSGTPPYVYAYPLTLNAYNSVGKGSTDTVLTVQAQGTPLLTSATTAAGKVGAAFSYQITASNVPTGYGVQGLPGGLTVNANTGLVSGMPKVAGTYTLTLNAYNPAGKGLGTLTLSVAAGAP